jgi:tetratricopeptide (TPR) repeat protein
MIAVKSRYQHAPAESQTADLLYLESQFAAHWGEVGAVAEAFGAAWSEVGDRNAAKKWYESAVAASDGSASIKATEQLANISARVAWESVDTATAYRDKARRRLAESSRGRTTADHKARTEAQRRVDAAEHALADVVHAARAQINAAIDLLGKLVSLHPTMERESLYGSAYKRLAMIEAVAGQTEDDVRAVREMKKHYQRAEVLGRENQPLEYFYPALNHMAADLVLNVGRRGWHGVDSDAVVAIQTNLEKRARDDPDFWSILGQTELRLYQVLASGELAGSRAGLEREYEELHTRVSSARMWASVYNTARFVLPRYAARASATEKHAAEALLTRLQNLARATDAS